jgi:hypothetical protein
MNGLQSKKGTAMLLLLIDLKGVYDRVDNVMVYNELNDSVVPEK